MVRSFHYGDWDQICRNVPSMSVCNLFLKQQLSVLSTSQYPARLALPDRGSSHAAFDVALSAAGVGVRSACAIPRIHTLGGYPGSLGNVANIICTGLAVLLAAALALRCWRRPAAVARTEMVVFYVLYGLVNLFELLSTGSFIRQGSAGIVWVSAIELGLILLLFWTLAWCSFLEIQLIEDGTLASLIPWTAVSVLFFIGFTYICLDTGFSVSGYFDSTDGTLHNNWIFTILIVLCGVFLLFAALVAVWVSGAFLRESRPLLLYGLALLFFLLAQGAMWTLSQVVCINTHAKVDGSFISTLCTMISVVFLFFAWKTVTEDTWDEVTTASMSEYDRSSHPPLLAPQQQGYLQTTSPLTSHRFDTGGAGNSGAGTFRSGAFSDDASRYETLGGASSGAATRSGVQSGFGHGSGYRQ